MENTNQLEFNLLHALANFGLDPQEWSLDFIGGRPNRLDIQKILIRNKADSSFKFLGKARIKRLGTKVRGIWLKLAWCE